MRNITLSLLLILLCVGAFFNVWACSPCAPNSLTPKEEVQKRFASADVVFRGKPVSILQRDSDSMHNNRSITFEVEINFKGSDKRIEIVGSSDDGALCGEAKFFQRYLGESFLIFGKMNSSGEMIVNSCPTIDLWSTIGSNKLEELKRLSTTIANEAKAAK